MRTQLVQRASALGVMLLVACSRGPRAEKSVTSAARPTAATPPASSPVPVPSDRPELEPEATGPQLALRLAPIISSSSVGDLKGPERFRVMVTWNERHIDEQIAELRFPNTCEAFAADATRPWRVTCTPRYRKPVAEAFLDAGDVVLRVIPERGAARLVRAPLDGHHFAPLTSEVGSRPAPCAPTPEPRREVNVTLPSANWLSPYPPATIFYLAVPGNQPFALIDEPGWWQGCKPQRVDDAIKIQCANQRHAAQIAIEGPSVRFEWQDRERYAGRILLPCNAHATLATPNFSEGYRYH